MLEMLRRGAKSWVAKGLILLLIASFAVWGISDVFSTSPSSAVASIGDETVTFEAYADQLQRQRNRLSQQAGRAISYAEMRQAGFDQAILAQMMRERAFRAELREIGITAPDAAVAEAIRNVPAFQDGGGFSPDRYRFALGRQGFSPAQFEALTRVELGQEVLTGAASGTGTPPPGMAPRIAAYQGERRGVATVILPPEHAPDPGAPTEAELEAQYEATPAAYTELERRAGVYLHISIARLAEAARPEPEAVEAWYEANGESLGRPATRTVDQLPLPADRAEALAERVRSGETSFEALARELGEDPAAIDFGAIGRGELPDAVDEAVFAATEPGLVGPVEAPTGPVLVRIRAVQEGGTPALEEVRDAIAERLARDAAYERAPELANEVDDLRAEGRTLPEIAEATGLDLRRFEGLARDGSLAGGGRAEGLPATEAFRAEAFEALDHEERDLRETEAGGFFLLMVERIEESHLKPLEEVRAQVTEDWAAARRLQALEEEAEKAVAALAGPETLEGWVEGKGLTLTEHDPFPRDLAPSAIPFALVSELFEAEEGEAAFYPLGTGRGVMIAEVTAVEPLEPEPLGELSGRVERAVARQIAEDQQELFARAIEESYEVEIHGEALQAVFDSLGARSGG